LTTSPKSREDFIFFHFSLKDELRYSMPEQEDDEDACKCLSTQFDSKLGHTVCIDCGRVLEEHAITAELGFSETKSGAKAADGFFIGAGLARAKAAGGMRCSFP
jgi:hypothetical protein